MKKIAERNLARKLRRARSELKYFSNLLKDMSRENNSYMSEWLSDFNFITEKLNLRIKDTPRGSISVFHASEKPVDDEKDRESLDTVLSQKPDWAKKLYREIAKTSHPDKNRDSQDAKKMSEIFQKASDAFSKENFSSLVDIALDLDVPVEISNEMLLEKTVDRIKFTKKEISEIENSAAWLWGESLGLDDIRADLLSKVISKKFGTDIEREKILNVIDILNNT